MVFVAPANNRTTKPNGDPHTAGSDGPIPSGTYHIGDPHRPSSGYRKAGPWFTPAGVKARPFIGIHGGGNSNHHPGGNDLWRTPTDGCVRLSNDDDKKFKKLTDENPGSTLTVTH